MPLTHTSIDAFTDGAIYDCPAECAFRTSNALMDIARVGGVYFKLPSSYGSEQHSKLLRKLAASACSAKENWSFAQYPCEQNMTGVVILLEFSNWNEWLRSLARAPGGQEIDGLDSLLKSFPQFATIRSTQLQGNENWLLSSAERTIHWLILHKLNHDLVQKAIREASPDSKSLAIPEARFVVLRRGTTFCPAIVQETISGASLKSMYSSEWQKVDTAWLKHLPYISPKLKPFIEGSVTELFDWNPDNFIYASDEKHCLYYVDPKPTYFLDKSNHLHNLYGDGFGGGIITNFIRNPFGNVPPETDILDTARSVAGGGKRYWAKIRFWVIVIGILGLLGSLGWTAHNTLLKEWGFAAVSGFFFEHSLRGSVIGIVVLALPWMVADLMVMTAVMDALLQRDKEAWRRLLGGHLARFSCTVLIGFYLADVIYHIFYRV